MNFQNFNDVEELLLAPHAPASQLYAVWNQRFPAAAKFTAGKEESSSLIDWTGRDPSLIQRLMQHALRNEEYLLVCDAAREVSRMQQRGAFSEEPAVLARMRLAHARALLRIGSRDQGRQELHRALRDDTANTMGRSLRVLHLLELGDSYCDEAYGEPVRAAAAEHMAAALRCYEEALHLEPEGLPPHFSSQKPRVQTFGKCFDPGQPNSLMLPQKRKTKADPW